MAYKIIPLSARANNLSGKTFGRLTVIAPVEHSGSHIHWLCICSCGTEHTVDASNLRSGGTKSCGCFKKEASSEAMTTHGMAGTPEYKVWEGMKQRTMNEDIEQYPAYGGRGITLCERWNTFEQFYEDMGPRPGGTTLDRIDNDGPYTPDNCRWATPKEQANNRRSSIIITFDGMTLTLAQWAEKTGLTYATIWQRLHRLKWPVTRALTETSQYD